MGIQGAPARTLWEHPDQPDAVCVIDQRSLPHELVNQILRRSQHYVRAIREMWVRGAPLIGATAAYGMAAACREARTQPDPTAYLARAAAALRASRPTAVDLFHAVARVERAIEGKPPADWPEQSRAVARALVAESVAQCRAIGEHGLPLIEAVAAQKPEGPVQILTHCNAGWLACLDYGTATAPIYLAHDRGIAVHVWVDETRPRNQGARLTAFELEERGVPHTVITDNAGGLLMQRGQVDLVIVGTDRTTRHGDVANKIGTYLKALAAHDNGVPFYVALPGGSIDWDLGDGQTGIEIEERDAREVTHIQGLADDGTLQQVQLTPRGSAAVNYGFDVTPARLVSGLITERGVCAASEAGLVGLYPERQTTPS